MPNYNQSSTAPTGLAQQQGHSETLYPPSCSYLNLPVVVVFLIASYLISFSPAAAEIFPPCVENTWTVPAKQSSSGH